MLTSVSSFSPPVPYQVFPNNIQRLSQHDSYALECFIKLNSRLFGILQVMLFLPRVKLQSGKSPKVWEVFSFEGGGRAFQGCPTNLTSTWVGILVS